MFPQNVSASTSALTPVLRLARGTLESLEAQQRAATAQIDLFGAPSEVELNAAAPQPQEIAVPAATISAAPAPADPSPLERAMAEIDPDALTPRGALELLYRLKALASDA